MKAAPKQADNDSNRSAANLSESSWQNQLAQVSNDSKEAVAQRAFIDGIHDSPRMLAQRRQIEGYIGAVQQQRPDPIQPTSQKIQQQILQHSEKLEDEEKNLLMGVFATQTPAQLEQQPAPQPNNTGLPDNLKSGIESLSGFSMDNVKVHYNSSQPARLNALAYAQGTDIHIAPGQEQHLPHEAWHVIQQAQGRVVPTMQMKNGVPVNDDVGLEHEADEMGGRAAVGVTQSSGQMASPGHVASRKMQTIPVLQRRIVISPEAFARGLNVNISNITDVQINEYIKIAIYDDMRLALSHLENEPVQQKLIRDTWDKLTAKGTTPENKLELLNQLIPLVNDALDTYQVFQKEYQADRNDDVIPIPNCETRYATSPKGNPYKHTSLNTNKAEGTRWGSDPEMHSKFAEEVGKGITEEAYGSAKPSSKSSIPLLRQLPWAEAKRLLPRPLINLIFDVRYQLETEGATVIDERTPFQKGNKNATPNEGGTLRSWHQDSHGVLPAANFNAKAVPAHATALHTHYNQYSQGGSGSSIKEAVKEPQGLAEYTGTGSNTEHNTKVVLDYINKRVYLTLTHYQYWALVERPKGKYVFWPSNTQILDNAEGNLRVALREKGELFGAKEKDTTMMNPWLEILMPTAETLVGKQSIKKTSDSNDSDANEPTSAAESKQEQPQPQKKDRARKIGNCLYDAVNDALSNVGNNADKFREIATSWIIENQGSYSDLGKVANIDEVVSVLSKPGAWTGDAGDLSPLILASSLGITLLIVTPEIIHEYAPLDGKSKNTVMIFYSNNHYTDIPVAAHGDNWEKLSKKPHTLSTKATEKKPSEQPQPSINTNDEAVKAVEKKIERDSSTIFTATPEEAKTAKQATQRTSQNDKEGSKTLSPQMNKVEVTKNLRAYFPSMPLTLKQFLLAAFSISLIVAILYYFLRQ